MSSGFETPVWNRTLPPVFISLIKHVTLTKIEKTLTKIDLKTRKNFLQSNVKSVPPFKIFPAFVYYSD